MKLLVIGAALGIFALSGCSSEPEPWSVSGSQGIANFVEVDESAINSRSAYLRAANNVCGDASSCQVHFFAEGSSIPRSLPMTEAQTESRLATYQRNTHSGLERLLLKCGTEGSSTESSCM